MPGWRDPFGLKLRQSAVTEYCKQLRGPAEMPFLQAVLTFQQDAKDFYPVQKPFSHCSNIVCMSFTLFSSWSSCFVLYSRAKAVPLPQNGFFFSLVRKQRDFCHLQVFSLQRPEVNVENLILMTWTQVMKICACCWLTCCTYGRLKNTSVRAL